MTPLRDLANGLPAVLGGQILLVACSVFYLIWWTVVFAPDGRTPRPSGALFLAGAAFAGLGGLVLLVWITMAVVFRYSSLAALTASLAAPVIQAWGWGFGPATVGTIIMSALLIWRTRPTSASCWPARKASSARKPRAPPSHPRADRSPWPPHAPPFAPGSG